MKCFRQAQRLQRLECTEQRQGNTSIWTLPMLPLLLCHSGCVCVCLTVWLQWCETPVYQPAIQTHKAAEHMGDRDNFVARRDNCEQNASALYSSGWVRPKYSIVSILFSVGDKFLMAYGTYYSAAGSKREQNKRRRALHSYRNPGAFRRVNTQARRSSNLSLDNPLMI